MTPRQVWVIRGLHVRKQRRGLIEMAMATRMANASKEEWKRIVKKMED